MSKGQGSVPSAGRHDAGRVVPGAHFGTWATPIRDQRDWNSRLKPSPAASVPQRFGPVRSRKEKCQVRGVEVFLNGTDGTEHASYKPHA
ncbi:hypothetical protein K388_07252 [Streptomyces sp. KhCrAH-43]|nr:hypothetical protein K388_07252 [Streptomyces sp. KhCrAH-43]